VYDPAALLGRVTQAQWDEMMAGKPLASETVRQYKSLIVTFGFKDRVLGMLGQYKGEEVLGWIQEHRPDLKIGDRATAITRIDAEMKRAIEILKG